MRNLFKYCPIQVWTLFKPRSQKFNSSRYYAGLRHGVVYKKSLTVSDGLTGFWQSVTKLKIFVATVRMLSYNIYSRGRRRVGFSVSAARPTDHKLTVKVRLYGVPGPSHTSDTAAEALAPFYLFRGRAWALEYEPPSPEAGKSHDYISEYHSKTVPPCQCVTVTKDHSTMYQLMVPCRRALS
eukprot:g418.t1